MGIVRTLVDHPDERIARRARLLVVAVVVLVLATAVLATYGRSWSWTGFQGNENVWEWLQLLAQPLALIFVLMELLSPPSPRKLAFVLGCVFGVLGILLVGGYVLHWGWTGFDEYRLWDWLHLLVLPVMLVVLPVWLRAGAEIPRGVRWLLCAIGAIFAAAFVGGYTLGWAWTGCGGKTFRDWLSLLITPFVLPVACKWFVAAQHRAAAQYPPSAAVAVAVAVGSGPELSVDNRQNWRLSTDSSRSG